MALRSRSLCRTASSDSDEPLMSIASGYEACVLGAKAYILTGNLRKLVVSKPEGCFENLKRRGFKFQRPRRVDGMKRCYIIFLTREGFW